MTDKEWIRQGPRRLWRTMFSPTAPIKYFPREYDVLPTVWYGQQGWTTGEPYNFVAASDAVFDHDDAVLAARLTQDTYDRWEKENR